MHGENPSELVKAEQKRGIGKVVFLGDYDTPDVLRDLRKLRIPKKFLVGNHDYHYLKNIGISSSLMRNSVGEYSRIWHSNHEQTAFLEKAIAGKGKNSGITLQEKLDNGKTIAYCHGGLRFEDDDYPLDTLWRRMIYSSEQVVKTFLQMEQEDYWILFRGHDHHPNVISLNKKPAKIETPIGEKLRLSKNKRHIVTIGSFYHGNYATFNSEDGILEHKNTGYGMRLGGI